MADQSSVPREPEDVSILRHAMGIGCGGGRNHFVTGAGSSDYAVCSQLVAKGLMLRHSTSALTGGEDLFTVTYAGREHVREYLATLPPPRIPTPGQQRYQEFLNADSGLSFAEWIGGRDRYQVARDKDAGIDRRKTKCRCVHCGAFISEYQRFHSCPKCGGDNRP